MNLRWTSSSGSFYRFGINGDLRRLQFCYFNLLLGCRRWNEVTKTWDKPLKVDFTHLKWMEDILGVLISTQIYMHIRTYIKILILP